MARSRASRRQIARTLTIAYGEGLLFEDTLQRRLDEALGGGRLTPVALYDGDFDRTNLPDPVVLTNYFSIHEGKIGSRATILNRPSDY